MRTGASRELPQVIWALPRMARRRWVCSRWVWHSLTSGLWPLLCAPPRPPQDVFARGMELHAKVTLLAEGCHGSLGKSVMRQFALREHCQHQSYAIGLKEVGGTVRQCHSPPHPTVSPLLPVGVGD